MATREELEERLSQARARVAEQEREREERTELARLEAEAMTAERRSRDLEALTAAELEHGPEGVKIRVVETALGAVIVKRPNALHFRRFQDEASIKTKDLDRLVRSCRVHPDEATFDRILEEQPAALLELANAVTELAGARAREVSGK